MLYPNQRDAEYESELNADLKDEDQQDNLSDEQDEEKVDDESIHAVTIGLLFK